MSQLSGNLEKSLRRHELENVIRLLRSLASGPRNTLKLYRELCTETGFRNHHSFYRQLRFCLQHRLIELAEVKQKWGIPTKTYRLTEKGRKLLEALKEE
ncbi:MAG: helix-turn-helix transcriptional regulator [Candidatus Bathyarchaeia archaeon]